MTLSSLAIDQEMENFGWSENLTTVNSEKSNDSNSSLNAFTANADSSYRSIIENTMAFAIFCFVFVFCLIELLFEIMVHDVKINISLTKLKSLKFSENIHLPLIAVK